MIKQSSKRLVSMIFALGFVILALVVLFDLVQPEYQNFSTLKGQVVAEQTFLQSATDAIKQAQKIIAEYQTQTAAEQSVNLAVPTIQDVPGALAQLYGIASANSLVIQTISVSAPQVQAQTAVTGAVAGTTGAAQGSTVPSIVKPLGNLSFQVTAAGSYESLENFLASLETNVRIFDLKGLAIAPAQGTVAGKNAGAANLDFFTYTMSITSYYQTK